VKVLVVGTGGALVGSGITSAADQVVRTLRTMGHDAERLVAGDRPRRRPNRMNLENIAAVLREAATIARGVRRHHPDVVWLHTFGVPLLPAVRMLLMVVAARALRRPVLVSLHAFDLEGYLAHAGRTEAIVLRSVGRLARALVVLREPDAAAVRAAAPCAAVRVLPNWVDVPDDAAPLPASPPWRVVFVGSLTSRKGVPELLEAAHLLAADDIVFRLVGGGGDEGPDAVAAARLAAGELLEAGSVELAGEVPPSAIRSELRAAHLFVLPSRAEGMPVAMLEAMAEGRPVLVGDAGNMADIVREFECGSVLASNSPGDIAAGIREAVADGRALLAQGRRGHAAACDRFSASAARAGIDSLLATPPDR
jgi:glycosyltransferase involved in cell wall biosynthesis